MVGVRRRVNSWTAVHQSGGKSYVRGKFAHYFHLVVVTINMEIWEFQHRISNQNTSKPGSGNGAAPSSNQWRGYEFQWTRYKRKKKRIIHPWSALCPALATVPFQRVAINCWTAPLALPMNVWVLYCASCTEHWISWRDTVASSLFQILREFMARPV